MTERKEPSMIWRRIMAFISLFGLLVYTLYFKGSEPWVIGGFIFIIGFWVFNPDTFINLLDVWKDGKLDRKDEP